MACSHPTRETVSHPSAASLSESALAAPTKSKTCHSAQQNEKWSAGRAGAQTRWAWPIVSQRGMSGSSSQGWVVQGGSNGAGRLLASGARLREGVQNLSGIANNDPPNQARCAQPPAPSLPPTSSLTAMHVWSLQLQAPAPAEHKWQESRKRQVFALGGRAGHRKALRTCSKAGEPSREHTQEGLPFRALQEIATGCAEGKE